MEDHFLSLRDIEQFANELQEFGLEKDQAFTNPQFERLETQLLHTIEEIVPVQSSRTRGRPRKLELSGYTKKPEEMDKFWLRAFRRHFSGEYTTKFGEYSKASAKFWDWYLSTEGIPSKTNKYKSYCTKYKNRLFRNESFCKQFKLFFDEHASSVLDSNGKKIPAGSQKWDMYFSYGRRKLYWYNQSEAETKAISGGTTVNETKGEIEFDARTEIEDFNIPQNICMWNQ